MSVSGQRETANGFYVNGGDVQERMNGGTGVVPNLDSIEEFRLLTNNFDPEYGNYNGGIVNVVTKSGSDRFHGNLFEFFRNTNLDARNYFSPERAEFKQNQPGGTVGGPIKKGKIFFFGDYQATRTTQGIETGNIPVPSLASAVGQFLRHRRSADRQRERIVLGERPRAAARIPGVRRANRTTRRAARPRRSASFPTRSIPSARVVGAGAAAAAVHARRRTPAPSTLSTGAFAQTVRDDKGSFRVDGNTRFGLLTGYYFLDDYRLRQSVSRPAGRRERSGLRRADARPRAALVVRRCQDVRPRTR